MNETTPGLTPSSRRALKARAHGLKPVVLLGGDGLTPAVLAEIERALAAHGLIKIRASAEREERDAMLAEICARTKALAVQHIGKVFVVYREKPAVEPEPEDRTKLRKAAARKAEARKTADSKPAKTAKSRPKANARVPGSRAAGARGLKGTGRPGSRTASPRRAPEHPPRRPRTSR